MSELANRLILEGSLIEKSELRYTLAQIPVVEAVFNYSGAQIENRAERRVEFDLPMIAIGELAQVLNQAELGRTYRFEGFLNRKSLKSIKLRLHVTHISPIH
ncbi:MAG: primosomal replication protein N [Formosimonas sp.]